MQSNPVESLVHTKKKNLLSRMFEGLHIKKNHLSSSEALDSPMTFPQSDVMMEGYLTKISGKKYWQNKACYYILRSDTWTLCHYKRKHELTLLGEYYMNEDDRVVDVSDNENNIINSFEIVRPQHLSVRPLRFIASNPDAHMNWIQALNNAIHRRRNNGKSNNFGSGDNQSIANEESKSDTENNQSQEHYGRNRYDHNNHDNNNECSSDEENNNSTNSNRQKPKKSYSSNDVLREVVSKNFNNNRKIKIAPNSDDQLKEAKVVKERRLSNRKLIKFRTHSFTANGQIFTLDVKYQLIKSIGTGAYGAVISAKNRYNGSTVAVKKIANIFDDLVDAKRILRETRLLGHFHHKNIIGLLDIPPPMSVDRFEDMYIITDLMETDLHQVIYSMQPMSDDHIKYFLYQILCALYHIHSAGVIHRDIKPSNILLNANCDLKICDFGLARGGFPENIELTEYVVTRWYRAPEIMLSCLTYTEAVDIWAVGCILAEMLQREPLFPGNDYIHQLKLIVQFLGTPKHKDIEFVKNSKALRFLTKLPIAKGSKLSKIFPDANHEALDLLQKMLIFNPNDRITVADALNHPYLSSFFDETDLTKSSLFDFNFDLPDKSLTKEAIIDLLLEDIEQFHPEILDLVD